MANKLADKPMLILIRGLPGSGKSTLGSLICQQTDAIHLEADQFMIDRNGNYRFDGRKLRDVHARCEAECDGHLSAGQNVVVSNTFSEIWEMQAYLDMAQRHHAALQIIECHGRFGNVHGVPGDKIDAMRKRWQQLPEVYR